MRNLFNRLMFKFVIVLIMVLLTAPGTAISQSGVRRIINIPDISGYHTLKCDFHMHTVFSDGLVWPTVRVQEAYLEGLDAITISDHDDYAPHRPDIPVNFPRPYEIALPAAKAASIILIPGIEISRSEPFGHHNAIFVSDFGAFDFWEKNAAAPADTLKNHRTASNQGAFIFWNHPGWKQPDRRGVWTYAQDTINGNGWLGGIEVVNGGRYDPVAHQWCIEKKLTMMGNSDIHDLIIYRHNLSDGDHRPMTLVFASEHSQEGIKDALLAQRTAIWWEDTLIGNARYLKPIFETSMSLSANRVELSPGNQVTVHLSNSSDIPMTLERIPGESAVQKMINAPQRLTIPAQRTVSMQLRCRKEQIASSQSGSLSYCVTNFLVAPEQGLEVTLPLEIVLQQAQ
jgi:3',5'-nucleoside bisphosphate phosphatase